MEKLHGTKSATECLVLAYLKGGKKTQREIATYLGCNRREARRIIRSLRVNHGQPILSDDSGYWFARGDEELIKFLEDFERKTRAHARSQFETYRAMGKHLPKRNFSFFDKLFSLSK